MPNYVRLQEVAERLIRNAGRKITFQKADGVLTDSSKPWLGSNQNPTSLILDGVFVPPNTVRQFGISALGQGTEFKDLISFSEQMIITAQGDNDLRDYVTVVDDNVKWGVLGMQVLKPGDLNLIAFVGVRR